jgi:ketosteroid isomerase-like protein
MKKYLTLLLLIFLSIRLTAQNYQVLVKAEKAFEKSCLELGIRNGFLAHVDSNAIEFTGQGPADAKKFWRSLPDFEGIFSWSPSYSELSISGDWGYTTGNYEHRPKTLKDLPDECGQYTTVWGKNDRGEWKYLMDIGNSHTCSPPEKIPKIISTEKYNAAGLASQQALSERENEFINSLGQGAKEAYLKYGSANYILNMAGRHPVPARDSAIILLNALSAVPKYHPAGIKISPGKDMAVAYGTFDLENKTGSYVRIWRHEKTGWKIALEVIRPKEG